MSNKDEDDAIAYALWESRLDPRVRDLVQEIRQTDAKSRNLRDQLETLREHCQHSFEYPSLNPYIFDRDSDDVCSICSFRQRNRNWSASRQKRCIGWDQDCSPMYEGD